tara:strand:+ start:105 stop:1229 length:1125 start_codon:yes stop_codon:yes gene_type:complete
MKSLLFYGTTNYGFELNKSDKEKFLELSKSFHSFVITYGEDNRSIDHKCVTIKYIKKPSGLMNQYLKFYLFNFRELIKFIKENNIEIISAKDPISAFLPILIKKYFIKDLQTVIEHHGEFIDLLLNQRKFYLKGLIRKLLFIISNFTYKNCDLIRGVEKESTSKIAKKYKKKNIIFPAWVNNKIYLNKNLDRKNFLFVGNVIPRKGVLFIIEQFDRYVNQNKLDEKLIIAGDTPNESYLNKCQNFIKINNIKNVIFTGKKSPEEISDLMNASKLLLMASSFEGLPRVLIESGLCGLPSLASDIQGISSPFGKYGGTLLYKYNDAEDFIIKIDKFYKDPEFQLKLSDKSSELSKNLSGENKFTKNWEKIEEMLYE